MISQDIAVDQEADTVLIIAGGYIDGLMYSDPSCLARCCNCPVVAGETSGVDQDGMHLKFLDQGEILDTIRGINPR